MRARERRNSNRDCAVREGGRRKSYVPERRGQCACGEGNSLTTRKTCPERVEEKVAKIVCKSCVQGKECRCETFSFFIACVSIGNSSSSQKLRVISKSFGAICYVDGNSKTSFYMCGWGKGRGGAERKFFFLNNWRRLKNYNCMIINNCKH